MAKYFGKIGFLQTKETSDGVYEEDITERNYYGDVLNYYVRPSESSDGFNDNIRINNKISIISDSFAVRNLGYMKYATWKGACWKIHSAEVIFPRIILTLGDLYNEPTKTTS